MLSANWYFHLYSDPGFFELSRRPYNARSARRLPEGPTHLGSGGPAGRLILVCGF